MNIRPAAKHEHETLVKLWERSVKASHEFLTPADIADLKPAVRNEALPALNLWVAEGQLGRVIGFMGMHKNSVEALFIDPDFTGQGAGRALLDRAKAIHGGLRVDVNEQNPKALNFYLSYGFQKIGRSPLDSGGRPFPIIHMELSDSHRAEGDN